MIITSKEVRSRKDFTALCNARELHLAIEVGTDQGHFAKEFLTKWDGYQLYCIDPYLPYGEMNRDRTPDYDFAVYALAPFGQKARILKMTSEDAAKWARHSLPKIGFVYIDARHDAASVNADLYAWWPLVAPGGILAGHDFADSHPGVKEAVTAFGEDQAVNIYTTQDAHTTPSWYINKPEAR